MKVRRITLPLIILLPIVAVSILISGGLRSINVGENPVPTVGYWAVFYTVVILLIYGYPRIRHNISATFYYWKIYVKYVYPLFQIPVRYSIVSLTIGSLLFTGLIVVATDPTPQTGLIVITAFYASVLFFREIFSSDVPVLEIDDLTQMGAGMGQTVSFQTDIGNVGSKTATDPTVEFRLYDLRGRPLTKKMDADLPSGDRALTPGEWTNGGAVSIHFERADITDNPPETVYLHTKTYAGFGYALLADNQIQQIEIPVQNW